LPPPRQAAFRSFRHPQTKEVIDKGLVITFTGMVDSGLFVILPGFFWDISRMCRWQKLHWRRRGGTTHSREPCSISLFLPRSLVTDSVSCVGVCVVWCSVVYTSPGLRVTHYFLQVISELLEILGGMPGLRSAEQGEFTKRSLVSLSLSLAVSVCVRV
jgi:hypothetical protein